MSASSLERSKQASHVFELLLDMEEGRRRAELRDLRREDPDLKNEVDELLAAHRAVGDLFEQPVFELDSGREPVDDGEEAGSGDPTVPARLGRYRIERLLGCGGMADVYLAARSDGAYRQKVAIKVVRSALGGTSLERRFRRERQILADLDHPHVARLLDGGTLPDGRPYLVMELVHGVPLDRYCEQRGLGLDQRLALFLKVCHAVQHAHSRGVIHRDLKPANVLVDGDGEPHLIDFGIAGLLAGPGEATELTIEPALMPLTPAYASPEQRAGRGLDASSDVFSLGTLLYSLLTGTAPFPPGLLAAAADGNAEPVAALASKAAGKGAAGRRLKGDLDAILARALRWCKVDRYPSVRDLAADLERHLKGAPVAARRGSLRYRWGRALRRHRLWLATAAVALVLVASLTGLWAMERQVAHDRLQQVETSQRAVLDLLQHLDPLQGGGGDAVEHADTIAVVASTLEDRFRDQPDALAALLDDLAANAARLGDRELSGRLLRRAAELGDDGSGERRATRGRAWHLLAKGDIAGAHVLATELASPPVAGEDRVEGLVVLGESLVQARKIPAAEEAFREALRAERRLADPATDFEPYLLVRLAGLRYVARDLEAAEAMVEQAMELAPEDSSVQADALAVRGLIARARGEWQRSRALLLEAHERHAQRLPPDHPTLAGSFFQRALLEGIAGDPEQAVSLFRRSLALAEAAMPAGHPDISTNVCNLGRSLHSAGQLDAAERVLGRCLASLREAAESGVASARHGRSFPVLALGLVEMDRGRPERAETFLREALEIRQRVTEIGRPYVVAEAQGELADCWLTLGRHTERAREMLRESHRHLTDALPEGHLYRRRSDDRAREWLPTVSGPPSTG